MLIARGTVLTVNADDEILEEAWIRVRDSAIETVSATALEPETGEEVIDATGCAVLPGMVNTHTHLFQTLLRGVYDERPLATYLSYIYRCGLELTSDDSRISARLGAIESIRSGVTTVADHHFLNRGEVLAEATVEGMREGGVRAVLARTVMDIGDGLPPEILETAADGLRSVERLLERYAAACATRMVSIWTGPNTPGVNSSSDVAVATREFAEAHGIRRSAHIAEYKGVLDHVKRRYGYDGAIDWLDTIGALGPDLLAVHAVHVRPDEVTRLATSGAAVSHNPFSNLFCGDRNAPVSDYLAAGMSVGFGTDGAANNNGQTVIDALRISRLLQRLHPTDPTAISPVKALRMATVDGARALGLDDVTGSIEPGKRADLILVDLSRSPHAVPMHDVLAHVVHYLKGTDVRSVLVDGRVVMRDRQVLTVDEPAVLEGAQTAARGLVQRLG